MKPLVPSCFGFLFFCTGLPIKAMNSGSVIIKYINTMMIKTNCHIFSLARRCLYELQPLWVSVGAGFFWELCFRWCGNDRRKVGANQFARLPVQTANTAIRRDDILVMKYLLDKCKCHRSLVLGIICKESRNQCFVFSLSNSLPSRLLPASHSSHLPFKVSEGKWGYWKVRWENVQTGACFHFMFNFLTPKPSAFRR